MLLSTTMCQHDHKYVALLKYLSVCVCLCAHSGWHPAVRRGSCPRVVSEGLPDHTGGGGGRQEHQQTGGTRDAHGVRHPHSLVGPSIPVASLSLARALCTKTTLYIWPANGKLFRFWCSVLNMSLYDDPKMKYCTIGYRKVLRAIL